MAQYFEGVGRRKSATARVRIMTGSGTFVINQKTLEEYFPTERDNKTVTEPLGVLTGSRSDYDISVLVKGGGVIGQADSVRLGLARAILKMDPELRTNPQPSWILIPRRQRKRKEETRSQRRTKGPDLYKALVIFILVNKQSSHLEFFNSRRAPSLRQCSPLFLCKNERK